MEEECKGAEIMRDQKQKSLEYFCDKHKCFNCPLVAYCDEVGTKCFKHLTDVAIDRLYEEYILNPKCEVKLTEDQKAKADAGKAEIRLVPMEIVWAIAWIRMYGNRKYGDPENWKLVEPERYRDALMRHLLAYISDPKSVDEESGYPHLWHAACNMAFLMHFDYGDMCHYDFAVKKPEWEKIGKNAVENNHISPSEDYSVDANTGCFGGVSMMSPDEALKRLKELSEDLRLGWVDIYEPAGGADEIVIKALEAAIAALEEKKHEQ